MINTGITGIVINDFNLGIMSLANFKSEGQLYVMESNYNIRLGINISSVESNKMYKYLKFVGLKHNTLFVVLSSKLYKSIVQPVDNNKKSLQELINYNKAGLNCDEDSLIRHRVTAEDGVSETIYVESIPSDFIDNIYKAFAKFNIKILITEDSLYSLMGLTLKHNYEFFIFSSCEWEHLNSYVYRNGSLMWFNKEAYNRHIEDDYKIMSEAIDTTIAKCSKNYLYPTDMLLIGSDDEFSNDSIAIHTKELNHRGVMGVLDFILSNAPISKDYNKAIINYSPWHVPVIRACKCFCAMLVLAFALLLSSKIISFIGSMNMYQETVMYSQQTDSFEDLQNQMKDIYDERVKSEAIVNSIKNSGSTTDLDTMLRISIEHSGNDINILSVGTDYIIGYGVQLKDVTNYVKDLSDEIPYTVEINSVSQLKVGDSVYTGFELRIGGAG